MAEQEAGRGERVGELEPFAEAFGIAGDGIPDDAPVDDHIPEEYRSGVTWGDVRRARQALDTEE